jgi:hypothetical protein
VLTETAEGNFDNDSKEKIQAAAATLEGVVNGARTSYSGGTEVYVLDAGAYNEALNAISILKSLTD